MSLVNLSYYKIWSELSANDFGSCLLSPNRRWKASDTYAVPALAVFPWNFLVIGLVVSCFSQLAYLSLRFVFGGIASNMNRKCARGWAKFFEGSGSSFEKFCTACRSCRRFSIRHFFFVFFGWSFVN